MYLSYFNTRLIVIQPWDYKTVWRHNSFTLFHTVGKWIQGHLSFSFVSVGNNVFFGISCYYSTLTVQAPTPKAGNSSSCLHWQHFPWLRKPMAAIPNRTSFQHTEHTEHLYKWNAAEQTHLSLLSLQGCMYSCDWSCMTNRNPNQSNGEKQTRRIKHFSVHYCFRDTCIGALVTCDKHKSKPRRDIHRFWMTQLHWEHIYTRLRSMHTGIFLLLYN